MPKRPFPRIILIIALGCLVFPFAVSRLRPAPSPPPPPFQFPMTELAALDRDLQARFAVLPDKSFGIVRTYGNQHYLYNPNTATERATIAALRKKKTEAAFYLMSRALWLRTWDGWGYKPIQGPVALTGKIKAPLPRRVNFMTKNQPFDAPILDQENGFGPGNHDNGIPTHDPNGKTVPSPTPPSNAPGTNLLQELGNQVFATAENAPPEQHIGASTVWKGWKVVAVPVRASQKECLPCHTYQTRHSRPLPGKTELGVGDALGVAFYAYRSAPSRSVVSPK